MNKVILMGRLVKDSEVRYGGANNSAVARFTLAVDRKFKKDGEPTADFINCVAFGKTAEFLEKYGKKGTKFIVEGRIQTGSYEKDGKKVYTTDIAIESVEFAESKTKDSEPQTTNDGFMPLDIEESLPFN